MKSVRVVAAFAAGLMAAEPSSQSLELVTWPERDAAREVTLVVLLPYPSPSAST